LIEQINDVIIEDCMHENLNESNRVEKINHAFNALDTINVQNAADIKFLTNGLNNCNSGNVNIAIVDKNLSPTLAKIMPQENKPIINEHKSLIQRFFSSKEHLMTNFRKR